MEPKPPTPRAQRRALAAYVALMRAAQRVTERTHAHLAEHELSVPQFAVLEALLHVGPLSQSALVNKVLCSPNNMTSVIDRLEARQLVERRVGRTDRRVREVHLLPQGRALIEGIFPTHAAGLTQELGRLKVNELEQLTRACRALAAERGETR